MSRADDYLRQLSAVPRATDDRKPHVVLVIPPSPQVPTPGREFFLRAPIEGISYISTVIKNAGYRVDILDYRAHHTAGEALLGEEGVVVGITTFIDSFCFLEDLISKIRSANASATVVLGGPFVSSAPALVMRHLPADYAVLGEGELTVLELLDALANNRRVAVDRIPGLCVRRADRPVFTPPRPQIRDLDALPELDLDLWPAVKADPSIERLGMSSSRGCYANCSFCYKTIPLLRQMSAGRFGYTLNEYVRKYRIRFSYINDLTFVLSRERTVGLCRGLKQAGIRWACSTRVQDIDRSLLDIMKDSGCTEIWYGFESVDQNVLDTNCKGTTVEMIENAVKLTNAAGIKVMANFIIGLPGETDRSLERMIAFIEDRDVVPASIKYLTPFTGTPIYEYARTTGKINDEVAYVRSLGRRKVNSADDEIINCTQVPDEKLRHAFRKIRRISDERYRAARSV